MSQNPKMLKWMQLPTHHSLWTTHTAIHYYQHVRSNTAKSAITEMDRHTTTSFISFFTNRYSRLYYIHWWGTPSLLKTETAHWQHSAHYGLFSASTNFSEIKFILHNWKNFKLSVKTWNSWKLAVKTVQWYVILPVKIHQFSTYLVAHYSDLSPSQNCSNPTKWSISLYLISGPCWSIQHSCVYYKMIDLHHI